MAIDPTVTVAVESAVHQALAEVAKAILEQHGLRVIKVKIDWLDVSSLREYEYKVSAVTVKTKSHPK